MARSLSWPSIRRTPSSVQSVSSLSLSPLPFSLILLLFLSYVPSSTVAQAPSSIPFLTDQPLISLTLPSSTNNSNELFIVSVPLLVPYLSSTALVTSNAPILYATLPATSSAGIYTVASSYAASASGVQVLLLGQSYHYATTVISRCSSLDTNNTGLCNVTLVLGGASNTTVSYSVYTAALVQYNMGYTNLGTAGQLNYYARYIEPGDLNVLFELTSDSTGAGQQLPLQTAMVIASEHQLFTPMLLPLPNATEGPETTDQLFLLSPTATGFAPGLYIIGLWCNDNSYNASLLELSPNYTADSDSSTSSRTAVLSVMALILSSAVAAVILFRVCIICRRRNQLIVMSRAEVAVLDPPATANVLVYNGGVYHTQRQHGATEAEIATLPESVYVRSVASEGEEGDDPRCTICLDEYEPNVSHITTLRCGHSFHSPCVHSWLRQRRYCPLCLQIIDRAHDVKKERRLSGTRVRDMELVDLSSATESSRPLATPSFSRPTTAASAVTLRHWDDDDRPSHSVISIDDRVSRASLETPTAQLTR